MSNYRVRTREYGYDAFGHTGQAADSLVGNNHLSTPNQTQPAIASRPTRASNRHPNSYYNPNTQPVANSRFSGVFSGIPYCGPPSLQQSLTPASRATSRRSIIAIPCSDEEFASIMPGNVYWEAEIEKTCNKKAKQAKSGYVDTDLGIVSAEFAPYVCVAKDHVSATWEDVRMTTHGGKILEHLASWVQERCDQHLQVVPPELPEPENHTKHRLLKLDHSGFPGSKYSAIDISHRRTMRATMLNYYGRLVPDDTAYLVNVLQNINQDLADKAREDLRKMKAAQNSQDQGSTMTATREPTPQPTRKRKGSEITESQTPSEDRDHIELSRPRETPPSKEKEELHQRVRNLADEIQKAQAIVDNLVGPEVQARNRYTNFSNAYKADPGSAYKRDVAEMPQKHYDDAGLKLSKAKRNVEKLRQEREALLHKHLELKFSRVTRDKIALEVWEAKLGASRTESSSDLSGNGNKRMRTE
ncbi:hypothetical protein CC80DRAFT_499014 [Byssothecium circinans]|uniref:Uncharacterized protein n=1 Tax=Byssothecium circinans TaxID=147558 RepID=A0A6A5UDA7_9PLEO|nr:hypothetical protein CC80DRAFT_499014 [Byssothecium circinans]